MFLVSCTYVTKSEEYLKMKFATNNSNSISFIPEKENNATFEFMKDIAVNRSDNRHINGMIKSFLGMVYFTIFMYSLFTLLT